MYSWTMVPISMHGRLSDTVQPRFNSPPSVDMSEASESIKIWSKTHGKIHIFVVICHFEKDRIARGRDVPNCIHSRGIASVRRISLGQVITAAQTMTRSKQVLQGIERRREWPLGSIWKASWLFALGEK